MFIFIVSIGYFWSRFRVIICYLRAIVVARVFRDRRVLGFLWVLFLVLL